MSRILRRPMFRGGRVDSRGTGIASGLGYEKGGRVGFDNGGRSRAGVGYTAAPTYTPFSEQAMPWLRNIANTNVAQPKEEINTTDEYITIGTDEGPGSRLGKRRVRNPDYEPPFRWVDPPETGPGSTTRGGNIPKKRKKYLTEEEIAFTEGDFHPGQAELWRDPGDTSGTGNGAETTPEKTDAEKLAEYQEMFEKAYGSGRGDDISNMLLSFAGKALKPEATTKTAFGEFFEEEAKRPSESKKYKDAATTAAINAFLTGEKDFNAFMNQMKIMEHGVDYKTAAEAAKQKAYTINDYVIADKSGSTSQAVKKGARKVIEARGLGTKGLQILDEKDANDPKLLDPQNVGEVFMDEDNNIVFQLILKDGVIIKDFLYR